jgi:hypothetical protein
MRKAYEFRTFPNFPCYRTGSVSRTGKTTGAKRCPQILLKNQEESEACPKSALDIECGLEIPECASMAERRPTLTASARVGVRNHGRGGRKPAARSNKRKHRSKKESGLRRRVERLARRRLVLGNVPVGVRGRSGHSSVPHPPGLAAFYPLNHQAESSYQPRGA